MTASILSESASKKNALSIAILLLVPTLLLAIPAAADSEGGTMTTFSSGATTAPIELSGTAYNTSISIDSPQNITYQVASLEIEFNSDDSSPGQTWLDINMDGFEEWAWNGTGMGSIGSQTMFSTGANNDSIAVSSGTSSSTGIHLPGNSQVFTSQLTATFTPTVGGGLYSIGELIDIAIGNIDSDPYLEIIVLSDEPNGNSSANKSIGWMEWDSSTSSITNVTWAETCSNGAELRLGDVNNDSRVDIGVVVSESSSMCVHMSNSSNSGYNASNLNVSVGEVMTDIDFADIDGDGFLDVVSVHGPSGELSARLYRNATGNFADNVTQVVFENNSAGPQPAFLEELAVGELNGIGTGWYVLVADGLGHITTWNYNSSMQQPWIKHQNSLDGAKTNLQLVDVNSDGYLDMVGVTDMGHMVAIYNGTDWTSSIGSPVIITNSTFADVDDDGVMDIITPSAGFSDGNDATFVGELEVRPINASGIGAQVMNYVYEPVTAPTQIKMADLDGDGVLEHIVAGGESNPGIFIAGWHNFSIDIDQDGTPDGGETGYAGDGSAGQGPLIWSDDSNTVKDAIDSLQQTTVVYSQDLWNNDYFTPVFDVYAAGEGTVLLDSMNLSYDVTFTVDKNPYATGNLSNVLNQLMEAGNGTFNIPLPFNSTTAGKITLKNLAAVYTPGAPQLEIPPTPSLNLVSYDSDMVLFNWHDSIDLNNFVHFQIFRVVNGTTLDTSIHEFHTTILNMTLDASVVPGTTYDYFVRSIHSYGVASNLSDVLTVAIPFPGMIPSPATMMVDRSADDGGWLSISWDDPNSTTLDHFEIYLSSTLFSNISDMTPILSLNSTTFSIETDQFSEGKLVDGTPYWGACIPVDIYDRSITSVVAVGPVMTRNDSQMAPEVVVHAFTGQGTGESGVEFSEITRGDGLTIQVSLTVDSMPLADSTVNLNLSESSERSAAIAWQKSYTGITDSNGTWTPVQEVDWGEIIGSQHMHGTVIVVATYSGFEGDDANQPISAGVDSVEFEAYVSATFTADSTQVRADADGWSEVSATISTTPEDLSTVSSAVEINYGFPNDCCTGNTVFDSTGKAVIRTFSLPNGGTIYLYLMMIPYWLQVDGHPLGQEETSATIDVLPPLPEEEVNETENETQLAPLLDPVVTCDPITIPLKNPGSFESTSCQVYNENTFPIDIDWGSSTDWSGSQQLSVTIQPSSLEDISSQTSAEFEIRFSWSADITDLTVGNKTLLMMGDVHHQGITESITSSVYFTLEDVVDTTPDPTDGGSNGGDDNTSLDENVSAGEDSKLLTYAMYAGGGILGLGLVIVVGSMLFGGRSDFDDDDDDEDDDDWEDSFSTFDEDAPSASKALSRVKRPDSVKFQERRNKPEPEPEPEPEYHEPEYEEEWQEESDDGITVDEDGTEWWEDDDRIWWYRTPEMDDWAEFEE